MDESADVGRPSGIEALTSSFVTEQAVYGVILVSGMIVVSGVGDSTSLSVFVVVVSTVLVFWAAHVYAATVAALGFGRHARPVRVAFRGAVKQSRGLLVSALIPCAILLLGTARVIDDQWAIWAALLSGTVLLAALGWIAFRRRGASISRSVLGAACTAAFGGVMVLLKVVVVH
jgi:hypothetical protein